MYAPTPQSHRLKVGWVAWPEPVLIFKGLCSCGQSNVPTWSAILNCADYQYANPPYACSWTRILSRHIHCLHLFQAQVFTITLATADHAYRSARANRFSGSHRFGTHCVLPETMCSVSYLYLWPTSLFIELLVWLIGVSIYISICIYIYILCICIYMYIHIHLQYIYIYI